MYILSLDLGTTSLRAHLVNEEAQIVGAAQRDIPQHYPQMGFVEQDAEEIWELQREAIAEVTQKHHPSLSKIRAIGITNQRESSIVWDRSTGKPIYKAIIWQDRRTAPICEQLKKMGLEATISKKTGLVIDPYFSATKIGWILDNVPGARKRAEAGELAFGTFETWLVYKLTQGKTHITDASNASRTLLLNIHSLDWDEELLSIFKIPASLLPSVKSNSEIYAETSIDLFPKPIPISGMAGDQQASLFGHACFEKGMMKVTYGTGAFVSLNTGNAPISSTNRMISSVAWKIGHEVTYCLEGSQFIAGAAVEWLKENLHMIASSKEIDELACAVENSLGVFFVPALTGLGAPYWDPNAKGTLLGLTRGTTREHIARATLNSIAFSVSDLITCIQKDYKGDIKSIRVDGGVAHSKLMIQFEADLLQRNIERAASLEMTGLGAAFLAGLSTGFWDSKEEIASFWKSDMIFKPSRSLADVQKIQEKWKKAVEISLTWKDIETK
jgi:glycerol kinase